MFNDNLGVIALAIVAAVAIVAIVALVVGRLLRRTTVVQPGLDQTLLAILAGSPDSIFLRETTERVSQRLRANGPTLPGHVIADLTRQGRLLGQIDARLGRVETDLADRPHWRDIADLNDRVDGVNGRISTLGTRFNAHTHRFSVAGINLVFSVLWAIVTGLVFAGIWIIANRLISAGYINSHVGHNIALSSAWHDWWFTLVIAFFVFWIGFIVGGIVNLFWQLGRRRSFGAEAAGAEITSSHPDTRVALPEA